MSRSRNTAAGFPTYGEDLFTPEAWRDPFPHYQRIRDLGPVVRLSNPEVSTISRFDEVQRALRSPAELISGQGVGFNEVVNAANDDRPAIESDGERHGTRTCAGF